VKTQDLEDFHILLRALSNLHSSTVSWFGCGWQQRTKRLLYHSSPSGVGRRMERKRQKLMGRDKGNWTEQKTKQTVTTTILISISAGHRAAI